MNNNQEHSLHTTASMSQAMRIDVGLRQYMLKVYNYMSGALAVSGLTAYFIASSPGLFIALNTGGLGFIVMLAPLGFIMVLSFGINKLSINVAQALFWAFAVVMGISLSNIFMIYTQASITKVFFITSATFATMSIYGYTTKTNLMQFSTFFLMGLIGIIIASVVNLFMQSDALSYGISVVGVLVFVGLTAWDTQKIKLSYRATDTEEATGKKAIYGALSLYLDFINLLLFLLRLIGDRR